MRIRRVVAAALVAALAAALPVPALAQTPAPDTVWGEVPSGIRAAHIVSSAALQDTAVDRTIATVTVGIDGRFAFSSVHPGQYVVRVLNTKGETVATSLVVTMLAGSQQRAEFGEDRPAAALLPAEKGGINKTVLILAGAAAVGIVAVVALAGGEEPASPSR